MIQVSKSARLYRFLSIFRAVLHRFILNLQIPQTSIYIYKLVPSSDPPPPPVFEPPPERLLLSALDTQSGFIHLSAALQLPGTLERYFSDEAQV